MPRGWHRRAWLRTLALGGSLGPVLAGSAARAAPAALLQFPRDGGSHNDFATEWWYITGWVDAGQGQAGHGFQLTFFRSRVDSAQGLRSRLAARQLLLAHAAITDVRGARLWQAQRMERWSGEAPGSNALDRAAASTQDTGLRLQDWSLQRAGADLQARVQAPELRLELRFAATQPVLLQGRGGRSQKGPDPKNSSYYYSLPQLRVRGTLALQGRSMAVAGSSTAWLDHEWSQHLLPEGAEGWDWLGINLFDGSALTAFRLRDALGGTLWDGGSFRNGNSLYTFSRGEVDFMPQRHWQSPASRARYPVQWLVRTPADFYTVRALVDNQEIDSGPTTGALYWEGLCELWDSRQRLVGRGYLEMTGYASPLAL